MPTQPYFNAKGERIPSNTSVRENLGWKTRGLMNWQRNLFLSQMCEGCLNKLQDPDNIRDSAADAGTLAHAMIEADIKNRPHPFGYGYNLDQIGKACKAWDNFREWKRQTHFEPITMEVPVVSEVLQVGTTIDVIALVADKRSIVECKTSNGVYEDYLIQIALQKFCWEENYPDQPIEALHLLKVGKEEATFSHHYWENLDVGLEAFEHLRALHDLKKQLKKLI